MFVATTLLQVSLRGYSEGKCTGFACGSKVIRKYVYGEPSVLTVK